MSAATPPLGRRSVLGGACSALAAQLFATSCVTGTGHPLAEPVGDAHAHLFNAADLPVANFVRYVALPARFPDPPPWALAIVDLLVTLIKPLAATAEREAQRLRAGATLAPVPPARFGALVDARVRARTAGGAAALSTSDDAALVGSYRALVRAVAADSGRAATGFGGSADATAGDYARIARDALDGGGSPGAAADRSAPAGLGIADLGAAVRLLGWAYLMLLPRAEHLRRYCARFRTGDLAPTALISHLVDYDLWLDDAPSPGSGMLAQVDVHAALAARVSGSFDLRVFGGFCPLRHAIERLDRGKETTLDRLMALHGAGRLHGFKLYPPMGFRPTGNTGLADRDFDPGGVGRVSALDRWRGAGGGPGLGGALDAALDEFFARCVAGNIPMMAHAARSNGAGPGYADRADQAYWLQVAGRHPIRLSMGHLVDAVGPFVAAVERGIPRPDDPWSLASGVALLAPGGRAEVYGDIGYTQELLDDRGLAKRFFGALRTAFGARDPGLARILYGTDWIMLGIEAHNDRYLEAIERGMADAGYTTEQRRNVLIDNVRRFLRSGLARGDR